MMNYQSTSHTDHIHHQQPPPSYSTLIDQPTQHPSHPHQSQQSQPSSGLEAITTADERTRLLFDSSANSPVVAHQPSSSPPVSPLLIISSLLGSYLCCFITFILGISVTYPNTFIINHPGSFSLPITFSFLSALVFDLNLFIISPSSVRSRTYLISILSNFTSISFLTSLQLLSLILNPTLRSADLDLSLITGSILIVSTLIGSSSIVSIIKSSNLNTSSSPSSNRVSININLISLNLSQSSHNQRQRLSVWIPSFRSHNNSKFQRFRSWLSPYYARLLSALSFLLLCQVFWINIDSLKFSGQLYSVNIPTLTSKDNRFSHDHQLQTLKGSITTKVQLSCQWLNQPAEYFPSTTQSSLTQESLNHNTTLATHTSELSPIITQTIISFSPSRFTSYESTRWIQSLKTHPNSILSSSRLCQFDRPGYNFSDNLTINQISSSVIILEKALKTSGEFDRLHHNWNGVGSSGFVLVGHDYGALEAKLFASRNSRWINSIVYIDPQSGKRFFSDQLNLASFTTVVAWSFTNIINTALSTLNYATQRTAKTLLIPSLSFPGCYEEKLMDRSYLQKSWCRWITVDPTTPSMSRALIQERFLTHSAASKQELEDSEISYPRHVKTKVLLSSERPPIGSRDLERIRTRPGSEPQLCIHHQAEYCQEALREALGY